MARPRLCILSLSVIHQDSRVLREIEYAAGSYDVTVVGWGHLDRERPHVTMSPVPQPALSPTLRAAQVSRMLGGRIAPGLYEQWFWQMPGHQQALDAVIEARPDLIHANDAMSLPIAIAAARRTGAKVLFDAHEYSPGQRTNSLKRRVMVQPFQVYLIRQYAPQADAMITVEDSIARMYAEIFGLKAEVIRNVPAYEALPFHPVDPDQVQLIHHGGAMRDRKLEVMIEVMAHTDPRFSLTLMLMPDAGGYLAELERLAAQRAPGRITFRPPVAPADIARTINAYDIGLFLLPPVSLSYKMALPNKFFEFIMAGLAVAIGPSPAMAKIVRQYDLGVVADSFDPADLARKLNALSADNINAMKRRSLAAARDLNAENEMRKLHDIYARLLADGTSANRL
jgi:glycosyltransferase involved in cell wall biosynthesis